MSGKWKYLGNSDHDHEDTHRAGIAPSIPDRTPEEYYEMGAVYRAYNAGVPEYNRQLK